VLQLRIDLAPRARAAMLAGGMLSYIGQRTATA
jgi:hypothetical protein